MADPNEQRAAEFIQQASKKMKGGFFSGLFGSGKGDDAIDLYTKAANCYKIANNWNEAGEAFEKAARIASDNKSPHDAAGHYVEAANCFRKVKPKRAVEILHKAISYYTDMGRFTIAARHHMTCGEIYEKDCDDMEAAIKQYDKAADFYRGEECSSSANKCLLKVAHLAAQMQKYARAANIFEQVGKSSTENKLLIYGAKEYFLKAVLCHLCVDISNGKRALQNYEEIFPAFMDSREGKLMKALIEAIDEQNSEAYSAALKEYDSISRLDPWITTLFLKVKNTLTEEEDVT